MYLEWILNGEDVDVALVEEVVEDVDGVGGGGALSLILSTCKLSLVKKISDIKFIANPNPGLLSDNSKDSNS